MLEQAVKVSGEARLDSGLHEVQEPDPVLAVHEPVVKHTKDLYGGGNGRRKVMCLGMRRKGIRERLR
jgi:hypothetical protein